MECPPLSVVLTARWDAPCFCNGDLGRAASQVVAGISRQDTSQRRAPQESGPAGRSAASPRNLRGRTWTPRTASAGLLAAGPKQMLSNTLEHTADYSAEREPYRWPSCAVPGVRRLGTIRAGMGGMERNVPDIEQWTHEWRRVHQPHHALRAVAFSTALLLGVWFAALLFAGWPRALTHAPMTYWYLILVFTAVGFCCASRILRRRWQTHDRGMSRRGAPGGHAHAEVSDSPRFTSPEARSLTVDLAQGHAAGKRRAARCASRSAGQREEEMSRMKGGTAGRASPSAAQGVQAGLAAGQNRQMTPPRWMHNHDSA